MNAGSDTIAAIATAPGSGGVAVIRVSGPAARAIVERIFVRTGGGGIESVSELPTRLPMIHPTLIRMVTITDRARSLMNFISHKEYSTTLRLTRRHYASTKRRIVHPICAILT